MPSAAPTATSVSVWILACTRLWATSTARNSVIAEIGSAKVVPEATKVTAPGGEAAAWRRQAAWNAVRGALRSTATAARMTSTSAAVTSIGDAQLASTLYGMPVSLS
jgi:hypothetical protein